MTTYTVATVLADYNANPSSGPFAVSDTSANIAANLDALQALAAAGQLTSISLPSTPTLSAGQYLDTADGNVFQYVATSAISWQRAVADASSTTLGGVTGYLATVMSQSELNFIENTVISGGASVGNVYLGGQRVSGTTATWAWASGPEAGVVFWNNGPVSGVFSAPDPQNTNFDLSTAPDLVINSYFRPYFSADYGLAENSLNAGGNSGYVVEYSVSALTIAATQLASDATALGDITGTFTITPTGSIGAAAAVGISSTLLATLTVGLAVSDTAANVAASLDGLQSLAANGELSSIVLTDSGTPTLAITAAQLASDATALSDVTSAFKVAATGTIGAAATVGIPSTLLETLTAGLTVSDTAANVASNLDALQVLAAGGALASIALTDSGTPTLSITVTQLASDTTALGDITSAFKVTATGTIGAAAAVGISSPLLEKLTAGLAVSDTAANVATNLDALQTLAAAGQLTSISLLPTLTLSAGQYLDTADGNVFQYMATPGISWQTAATDATSMTLDGASGYLATVMSQGELNFLESTVIPGGSSTDNVYLGGQRVTGTTAEWEWATGPNAGTVFWNNGAVSGVFAAWDPTYGEITDTDLPVLLLNAYSDPYFSAGFGTALSTVGDGGNSGYVVEYSGFSATSSILTITATQLADDAAALGDITGTFTITATGAIGAAAAVGISSTLLAKLTVGLAVSDTAANVAANLDGLQSLAASGALASIALTEGGTSTLSITATQLANDATALGLIAGNYALSVTGVLAANSTAVAAIEDVSQISVSDTAMNVVTNLDVLQALAAGGELASIVLTDSGTPTLTITAAQLTSDAMALDLIGGSHTLAVTNFSNLTAIQMEGLSATILNDLISTDIASLTATQIGGLGSTQVGGLSSSFLNGLNTATIAALTTTQVGGLVSNQIGSLSSTAFSALNSTTNVAALSSTQLSGLTVPEIGLLTTTEILNLSATQISGLTTSVIETLGVSQLNAMHPGVLLGLTTTQVGGLTITQVGGLAVTALNALGTTNLASLSPNQVRALTTLQLLNLPIADLAALTATEVASLSTTQLASLNVFALHAFGPTDLDAMTVTQIGSLTTSQLAGLNAESWSGINTTDMGALSSSQIASLTTTQFEGLTATDLSVLTATQLGGLGTADIAILTTTQIGGLTPGQFSAFSTTQVAALTTTGIASLTAVQVYGLSTTGIADLTVSQAQHLAVSALFGLSADQIGAFTSAQIGAMTRAQYAIILG